MTQEQWDALTDEDKLSRADEKPQDGGQQTDTQKLQTDLDGLKTQLTEAKEQLDGAQREKSGIYHDLKSEREAVKGLKDKIAEFEAKIEGDDDTYMTSNKAKDMVEKLGKDVKGEVGKIRTEFMQERELMDERRMKARTDLKVPYDEAVKSFVKLCKTDKSYYTQVQAEAARPGGTPAELVYKLAITNDPEFIKQIEKNARDGVINDLNKGGKHRKLPAGGGGGGKPDYASMSMEDMSKLDDATLDKLARGEA